MKPHSLCFFAPPIPFLYTPNLNLQRVSEDNTTLKNATTFAGCPPPPTSLFFLPCSTLHYHKASKLQRHFIQPSANSHLVSSHSTNASEEKRCLCSNYSRPWSDWATPLYPLRVSNTGKFFTQRPSEPSEEKKSHPAPLWFLFPSVLLHLLRCFSSHFCAPCCTPAFLPDNRHSERCCLKTLRDAPMLISQFDIGADN